MLMKQGSQSNEVALVQRAFNLSTPFLPKLAVDGAYGPKTGGRARQFQGAKQLAPDGVVGPATLNALFTGVQLTGTIIVRRRRAGSRAPAPPVRPTPAPGGVVFSPFAVDPRDVQWHAQVQAWREWIVRPIPKGEAPPLPSTVPPSMSLPPSGLSVPMLPRHLLSIPERPPRATASAPVPLGGANFETSIAGGFKSGKLKLQEFKLTLDFAKVTGLINSDVVQHGVELATNDKGDLEVEQKISVTPFKLFDTQGRVAGAKLVTLLATTVNSSFDASQFAGVKGVVTFHPFGRGFEVSVGGKLGPKVKLSHDEDGTATTSVFPLAGEGNLEFEFSF